jgi:hypothetical protein
MLTTVCLEVELTAAGPGVNIFGLVHGGAAMKLARVVIAVLVVALAHSAHADVYEIPLPSLLGAYEVPTSNVRTVTVQLPGLPSEIRGASMRVRGSATAGTLMCDGPSGPAPMPWITTFEVGMSQATFRAWILQRPPENFGGPFAWTRPFEGWSAFGQPLPTWDLLMDGQQALRFAVLDNNVLLGCYPASAPPTVHVDEAVFLIDADFAVPAVPRTWGRLKSSYR